MVRLPGNKSGRPDTETLTPAQAREMIAVVIEKFSETYVPREQAMMDLVEAKVMHDQGDAVGARLRMDSAKVNATLSLDDSVRELRATVREVTSRMVDSNGELSARLREVA